MKKIFLILFVLLPFCLFSQSRLIDSLKNELKNTTNSKTKVDLLVSLATEYSNNDIDKAISSAHEALEILKDFKQDTICWYLTANVYNTLGIAYNNKGDYKKAIINFEKAIKFDQKGNKNKRVAEKLLNLGIIYKSIANYPKALELYDSSLKVAIKMNYQNLYTMTKVNMGVLNYEIGDYDKALKDYYEALKIKRQEQEMSTVAILLYNIGLIFDEKNDVKNANEHYSEALELFKKQSNLYGQAYCLSCIGTNFVKEQNYMDAIDYFNQAYSINEKLKNKQGMGESFSEIGSVYYNNGKYRKANEFFNLALNLYKEIGYIRGEITIVQKLGELNYDAGKYEKALSLYKRSLVMADSIKDNPQLKDAYEYLSKTYAKLGNYEAAYKSHLEFSVLKDTIFNKEVDDNITKLKAQHDISVRENEIKILKNEQAIRDLKIKKQRNFSIFLLTAFVSIFLFLLLLFSKNKKIRRANKLLAYQKRQITDSIEYASRIQTAILPPVDYIASVIPDHFILYKPRDIVSGDFYWITHKDGKIVVAVVDCTGHGVPGAFMSMLGFAFLNEIVNKETSLRANQILNQLRNYVKASLHQTGKEDEAKDGMDIALCIIDPDKQKLQYSGAYNPLYLLRSDDFISLKADRMPIGIHIIEKESFTNHEIDIQKGDIIYIFTDGYIDQFGGPNSSKFKMAPFKEMLVSVKDKPMTEQKELLEKEFYRWKGSREQIDDVLIMGIKI